MATVMVDFAQNEQFYALIDHEGQPLGAHRVLVMGVVGVGDEGAIVAVRYVAPDGMWYTQELPYRALYKTHQDLMESV